MPLTAHHGMAAVAGWLRDHRNLLLLSHERPDGDAYGCLLGAAITLQTAGWNCQAYSGGKLPERYRRVLPDGGAGIAAALPPGFRPDGILCLDCTGFDRLDAPQGMKPADGSLPVCCVDHHGDNPGFGQVNWIDPGMGAAAQMVSQLLRLGLGLPISPPAATAMLAGILLDTGAFQFTNTSPAVLREAALLQEAGADYQALINGLYFEYAYGLQLLKAEIFRRARQAHGRRLLYATLDDALLAACGVDRRETEGVIDVLRQVAGVDICAILQQQDGDVRVSLRGRSAAFPVSTIAAKLGGGGHLLAAGATLKGASLAHAEARLLELTAELLKS